jgi:hypothetical protein
VGVEVHLQNLHGACLSKELPIILRKHLFNSIT